MQPTDKAFIIGDIHGELDKLKRLIADIPSHVQIYSVGDIIDRGPKSRETIEFIRSSDIQAIKGNHEMMACECIPLITQLAEGQELTRSFIYKLGGYDWFTNGGKDVFSSYNGDYQALLTDLLYLQSLPLYIETGIKNEDGLELLVSHTWSAFKPLKQAATFTFDFVWNRNQPYSKKNNTPYYNVFGHTPTDYVLQKKAPIPAEPIFYDGSVNLDTGATYDTPTRGVLSGIFYPSLDIKQIKDNL